MFETLPSNPNAFEAAEPLRVTDQLCSARKTPAAFCLSLPARNEQGESRREGGIDKKRLLSPALSSFCEEERERKCGCALKANLLPNRTGHRPALRFTRCMPLVFRMRRRTCLPVHFVLRGPSACLECGFVHRPPLFPFRWIVSLDGLARRVSDECQSAVADKGIGVPLSRPLSADAQSLIRA